MRSWPILPMLLVACPTKDPVDTADSTEETDTDTDTDADADADTDADTDADADADADTDADADIIDDNTCDDGATSATDMGFVLTDIYMTGISGATWEIHDLDAHTGAVSSTLLASGTTASDGSFQATLDCADGWVLLETSGAAHLALHAYILVSPVDDWQLVTVDTTTAFFALEMSMVSKEGGFLAAYKIGADAGKDLQAADTFTLDGGANLVPAGAKDDQGLWIFEGAGSTEMFDVWYAEGGVPGGGTVVYMSYTDDSEGTTTALYAPVWSYDSGDTRPNMTVFHSVY